MFNSTFFLSIFSQKRSRREGLGCWMCPCGSGPLGAGCREGNVTVSRDGTGFSHVFTTSTQLLSAIYSQHLSAILSAIPPTSTYLRSCRLLLWSWKVWRPKKQAKRQVQTKAHGLHGCFLGWTCRSPETFRHNGWQVQDPGAEREAAAAAKIAVGQWISKAVGSPSLEFCQWWLWRSALNATSWCSIGLQETSRTCIRVIWFKDRARVNLLLKMGCSDWSVLAGYRDRFQRRHWNGNKSASLCQSSGHMKFSWRSSSDVAYVAYCLSQKHTKALFARLNRSEMIWIVSWFHWRLVEQCGAMWSMMRRRAQSG